MKQKSSSLALLYFIVFTIATFLTPNCIGQAVIFSENFSDNHRNWEVGSNEIETSYVKEGKYHIKLNEKDGHYWHWFSLNTGISDKKNWIIETTIHPNKMESEEGFLGLLWGAKDVSHMFQGIFYLKEKEARGIVFDSALYSLFSPVQFDTIETSTIKFTLLKTDNKFYFLINGKPAGKSEAYKLYGDKVGFVVSGKSEIDVDDLIVTEVSIESSIVQQIINKFEPTEEKTYYYDKDGFTINDFGSLITKAESEKYRVFTIDDNGNIVGYIKEYDTKTDVLIKKFQAKKLGTLSQSEDILIGEETDYNEDGGITAKVILHNSALEKYSDFYPHLSYDIFLFRNESGKIESYGEVRNGELKTKFNYDIKEQIEKIETTEKDNKGVFTVPITYEKNPRGGFDRVYRKAFDLNEKREVSGWFESESERSISKFVSDGYYLESKTYDGADRNPQLYFDFINNDFSIALTIKKLKGTEGIPVAAFILGETKDGSSGTETLFKIAPFAYEIKNIFNGIDVPIARNPNYSDIDRAGKTYINILKIGKEVIFSINGNRIAQSEYFPTKGTINLAVFGKNNSAVFSDLMIKELNVQLPNDLLKTSPNQKASGFVASGSGFFISNNGYIVTNNHVIEDAKEIYVDVNEDIGTKTYKAVLVKTDVKNDLAIIKIIKNLPPLPYPLNNSQADVGTSVFTLGYPYALSYLGKEVKFTDGKISSKSGYDNDATTYQISVPVQPGNSGGPLFDSKGNLVGVVNAKFTKGDNVSYAIKSTVLKNFLDLNTNIIKPTTVLKTSEIPIIGLIKKVEKFVVLIKTK